MCVCGVGGVLVRAGSVAACCAACLHSMHQARASACVYSEEENLLSILLYFSAQDMSHLLSNYLLFLIVHRL